MKHLDIKNKKQQKAMWEKDLGDFKHLGNFKRFNF
jgi:hypothetical protein